MPRKDYTSVQNVTLPADPASTLERLFPPVRESSMLMVACRRGDYSASRIARAVEDCDAHLLNLNVTADTDSFDNRIVAELRVGHRYTAKYHHSHDNEDSHIRQTPSEP